MQTLRSLARRCRAHAAWFLAAAAVSLAVGWWSAEARLADALDAQVDVVGSVTLDSVPLTAGEFVLERADGVRLSCPIANGRFALPQVAAGEWRPGLRGADVPPLYHRMEPTTMSAATRELRFGLKGSAALRDHAESLLRLSKLER